MPNRLAESTSPYLLQHQHNPVDWFPWGDEAFEKARREGKPVFLSVGYSSCHWCHVMEHESFEDERVAELLNRHFVSVKVDREERPDVDEAYMTAVQLSSGRGGWPMSVFLTPDRKPFFAGTYFPKEDRAGYPGFKTILTQIASAWVTKRQDLQRAADEFASALKETLTRRAPGTFTQLQPKLLHDAVRVAAAEFDPEHGGTRGAPKFPPHTTIEFLMTYALWEGAEPELREAAVGMALVTLEKMCLGGIHDHVGGGFHRYSTDEHWLLPHFEKMLYDNALILGNLMRATAIAQQLDQRLAVLYLRAASGIVSWLEREMTSPQGLFYSALDADSEGEEGKFYVWTEDEVRTALGEGADGFLSAFRFDKAGNFLDEATHQKTGANIPHLGEDVGERFDEELERLRVAREARVRPGLDDKALVGWNGLMINALAETGAIGMAERAAATILRYEKEHGRLPHQIAKGRPDGEAFLDDYAYLTHALLGLAALRRAVEEQPALASGELSKEYSSAFWRGEASRLLSEMVARFYEEDRGGFYSTSRGHEELFGRTMPAFDSPTPSANALAVRSLVEAGDVARARKTLEAMVGWMERAPQATEALHLAALDLFTAAPAEPAAEKAPPAVATPAVELEMPAAGGLPKADVRVRLDSKELRATDDGRARGKVVIEVPEGFHLNSSEPPARWLEPTRVEIKPLEASVEYPPASGDRYEGVVEIPFSVSIPRGEEGADFEVRVSYQACTEQECLLKDEKVFDAVALR